jgi:hypothetical protein
MISDRVWCFHLASIGKFSVMQCIVCTVAKRRKNSHRGAGGFLNRG